MNRCTKKWGHLVFAHPENCLVTYDFLALFEYLLTALVSEFGGPD